VSQDLRSVDETFRYRMPSLVARLYQQRYATHDLRLKLGYTDRFVDGLFRFVALVNLADAVPGEPPQEEWEQWLAALRRPSTGKLLQLVRQTSRFLVQRGILSWPRSISCSTRNGRRPPVPWWRPGTA